MLRLAFSELRFHPSRYVATLVAIAISIGFLAAASVVTSTEQNAIGRQQTIGVAGADLIVRVDFPDTDEPIDTDKLPSATAMQRTLAGVDGVAAVAQSLSSPDALKAGDRSTNATLGSLPPSTMRTSALVEGTWPDAAGQIALSRPVADALGAGVSSTVTTAFGGNTFTVVGITADPASLASGIAYVVPAYFYEGGDPGPTGDWAVKLAPDTFPAQANAALAEAVPSPLRTTIYTLDQYREFQVSQLTGGFDTWRNLLLAFAGIALVVGMITIANTFTILLAQRRRTTGLLRAIGASGAQVRRSILIEALLLGAVGSALGIGLAAALAAGVGTYTGSLGWGLVVPLREALLAVGVGILITVVAAFAPAAHATRVAPLEALQPVAAGESRRRASVARAVICGLLAVSGAASAVWALTRPVIEDSAQNPAQGMTLAGCVAGCVLMGVGLLFGAPLFVPAIFRGVAAVLGRCGTTARLAAKNLVRNPRRVSATATALMLAIGLIITLQATMASLRESAMDTMGQMMPFDIGVQASLNDKGTPASVPAGLIRDVAAVPGVGETVRLAGTTAHMGTDDLIVMGYDPGIANVSRGAAATIPDDRVLVDTYTRGDIKPGSKLTLTGEHGKATFTVVSSRLADWGRVLVSPAALDKLGPPTPDVEVLMSVPDRTQAATAAAAVSSLVKDAQEASPSTGLNLDGYVLLASQLETVFTVVTGVATALLAVAVLIALVGVSNTLTLSVIERTRESALMRALGLQRAGLRLMLLIEALVLALVGALVGVAVGLLFGWIGVLATVKEFNLTADTFSIEATFRLDPAWTIALLAVVVVAAALASVLPGRRAARATPVEALADL